MKSLINRPCLLLVFLVTMSTSLPFVGGCSESEKENKVRVEKVSERIVDIHRECVAAVASDVLVCLWAEGMPPGDATECAARAIAEWDCNGRNRSLVDGLRYNPNLGLDEVLAHTVITCNVDVGPLAAGIWRWLVLDNLESTSITPTE